MKDASDTMYEATTTSMKILDHLREKYDFDPVQTLHVIKDTQCLYRDGTNYFKRQRNCMILDGEINQLRIVMFTK